MKKTKEEKTSCGLCSSPAKGQVLCIDCASKMLVENTRLRRLYAAKVDGAHWLDAPDHPVCRCGSLSTHESGWCGACADCSKCGRLAFGVNAETPESERLCETCVVA